METGNQVKVTSMDEMTEQSLKRDYPKIKLLGQVGIVIQKLNDDDNPDFCHWRIRFPQFMVRKKVAVGARTFMKEERPLEYYFVRFDLTIINL